MFDNPVFVVILLVIVAALGAAAGFFAGRAKGQDMARGAKESDLNEAKAQIEADKQDISNLNAAVGGDGCGHNRHGRQKQIESHNVPSCWADAFRVRLISA